MLTLDIIKQSIFNDASNFGKNFSSGFAASNNITIGAPFNEQKIQSKTKLLQSINTEIKNFLSNYSTSNTSLPQLKQINQNIFNAVQYYLIDVPSINKHRPFLLLQSTYHFLLHTQALQLNLKEKYQQIEEILNNSKFAAIAIELLHTSSLIHDDWMDGDMERRGKPSCHAKFGPKIAVLAGDSLWTIAFEALQNCKNKAKELTKMFAQKAGINGMIGGQAIDMMLTENNFTITNSTPEAIENILIKMMEQKTGQLFAAALLAGGIISGAKQNSNLLNELGLLIGVIYQIKDDIKDKEKDGISNIVNSIGLTRTNILLEQFTNKSKEICKNLNFSTTPYGQEIISFINNI